LKWLKDVSLALRVGLSLTNVPKAYAGPPAGGELMEKVIIHFNGRGEPVDEVSDAR